MAIPRNLANLANQLNADGDVPKIEVNDTKVEVTDTGSNGTIVFNTDNAERMRINSAGNVGIGTGTSSPLAALDVRGTTVTTFSPNVYNLVLLGNQSATSGNSGSGIGFLGFRSEAGAIADLAFISGIKENTTDNNYDGALIFGTRFDGGGGGSFERMRINSNGYLLIGYTASNGAYRLQVNSQIFATSATIATSDGRYKENIEALDGALDLVTQLNPVQFSWKEHPVHNFDRSGPTVGFIAQEVQQVLADKPYLDSIIKANKCTIPEEYETVEIEPAIEEVKDEDGNVVVEAKAAITEQRLIKEAITEEFLGIAEGNMIALLTKAIQELKAINDAQAQRIETLEAKVAALEAK